MGCKRQAAAQSNRAAGWRARAIHVNDKAEAFLDEALKAVALADGRSIYDYIIEKDHLGDDWILVVNGITISDASSLKTKIKDDVQIRMMDKPAYLNPGFVKGEMK
jgi:hypothetical protein